MSRIIVAKSRRKEKLANPRDLSPFLLKQRIEKVRNQIAMLEHQRAAARESDKTTQAEAERRLEQDLAQARKRLEEVRVEIAKIKNDPTNYHDRLSIWDALKGQSSRRELFKKASRNLLELEDEEYYLLVSLGIERPPREIVRDAKRVGLSNGEVASSGQLLARSLQVVGIDGEKFRRFIQNWYACERNLYFRRQSWLTTDWAERVCDPCLRPIRLEWWSREANLDKQIKPLLAELSDLRQALGPQEQKLAELEGFRARVLKEGRDLARRLRTSCLPTDDCPYCENAVGKDARLDHIYPVSKGGLSVHSNLVFICLECNQKKSDMTLATFVKRYKLDREAIEARLTKLGKEF